MDLICLNTAVKSDLHPGLVFNQACQWFWFAQTLKNNSQPGGVHLISHQWFSSPKTLENNSQPGRLFRSVVLICSKTERDSQPGWVFSQSPVRHSDLLKKWRGTHSLYGFWPNLLVSGSELLNTREGLTRCQWMGVHIISRQWFWSAQTMERDSLAGWVFSQSPVSGSDLLKCYRETHMLDWCLANLVSGSDLLKCWTVTHILHFWPILLVILISYTREQLTDWMIVTVQPILVSLIC